VLAFRADNGLGLSPDVDTVLVEALQKAQPRAVSRERAEGKPEGSRIVKAADAQIATGIVGMAGAAASVVAPAVETAERAKDVTERTVGLLNLTDWLLPVLPWAGAAIFLIVILLAWKAKAARIEDSVHTHAIASVTGLQAALDAKADLTAIVGKQTIGIPAGGMIARTTGGAAYGKEELATNKVMIDYWAFDATTSEAVQARVRMPKGWNEGTVEAEFQWKHPATTVNFGVRWGVRARAMSDNEAMDGSWGSAVEIADTGGTTGNLYKTAFTAPLTIGSTPAEGDLVIFKFFRAPADAADTMAVDAHLMGVTITYTTSAAKDD
jgi:hypothetical protein